MTTASEIDADRAQALLDALTEIIARAAAVTLAVPHAAVARRMKPDRTPVTAADEASEAIIVEGLTQLLPGVPVIAEESVERTSGLHLDPSFVIVDPLDGTKEFLAGRDEFTVNIAIVTRGVAIAGLIAAPMQKLLWRGVVGGTAERLPLRLDAGRAEIGAAVAIHTRKAPERLSAAVSRSHIDGKTESLLAALPIAQRLPLGSSVKFCRIADGDVDIYPRLAATREWDAAAGCAILTAAGGRVTTAQGDDLRFGRRQEGFLVPGFIAFGDPRLAATVRV